MTTKALKRDLAALERDYGEDDDRSPKARAAEAQRAAGARMTTKALRRDLAALERDYGGSRARMTTKALKRDLAALERDYGEVGRG